MSKLTQYVRVTNKKSGQPQVLTRKTYENIQTNMQKLAQDLEFLYECDANGNKIEEFVEKSAEEIQKEKDVQEKAETEEAKKKVSNKTKTKSVTNGTDEQPVQTGEKKEQEGGGQDNAGSGESKEGDGK